jgi:DNA-binding transcriptional ArsR family regulator
MDEIRRQRSHEVDERIFKALAHPLRMSILTRLSDKVASPSDLAEELDEPLANVSYHFGVLRDLGCIELVETKPRRGALEHYYRALRRPFFSDDDWAKVPTSVRQSIIDSVLRQIGKDVAQAAQDGGFDRDEAHVSRTPLVLDEKAWKEVAEVLTEAIEQLLAIQTEAAERLAESDDPESGVASLAAILHFEGRDS